MWGMTPEEAKTSPLILHGFPVSNYYNKIKLALQLKQIPFHEEKASPSREEAYLEKNPLGFIPVLQVGNRYLSETQAIAEFLEEVWPEPGLLPEDVLARANIRRAVSYIENYIDAPLRRLAYQRGGEQIPEPPELRDEIERALAALGRIGLFSPWFQGNAVSWADVVAFVTLVPVDELYQKLIGDSPIRQAAWFGSYMAHLHGQPLFAAIEAERQKVRKVLRRAQNMAAGQENPRFLGLR